MARQSILYFILLSALINKSQACFCDHYPWTQWSSCSKTCNSGTQTRERWVWALQLFFVPWETSRTELAKSKSATLSNGKENISCRVKSANFLILKRTHEFGWNLMSFPHKVKVESTFVLSIKLKHFKEIQLRICSIFSVDYLIYLESLLGLFLFFNQHITLLAYSQ